jgi:hypothetical protein
MLQATATAAATATATATAAVTELAFVRSFYRTNTSRE